jgi:hypothetical protein
MFRRLATGADAPVGGVVFTTSLPIIYDSGLGQWIWSDLSLAIREVDHGKTCAEHVEKYGDVAVAALGKLKAQSNKQISMVKNARLVFVTSFTSMLGSTSRLAS